MDRGLTTATVRIELPDASLIGDLNEVRGAPGTVVFAHGSGSSRLSSRNRRVAGVLNRSGFSTLLFDLLTEAEAHLFEEPGALDEVARLAADWFGRHLVRTRAAHMHG